MQRTWVWFLAPTREFTNTDSSCFRGLCRSTESSYTYTQQDTHTQRIEINTSLKQRVFSWLLLSKANKIIISYQLSFFISLVHICAHMWLQTEGRVNFQCHSQELSTSVFETGSRWLKEHCSAGLADQWAPGILLFASEMLAHKCIMVPGFCFI